MPRMRSIIHAELHHSLQRTFFSRTVTIEAFTGVKSASGYRKPTPAEVAGLRDIPAAIAPVSRRGSEEQRGESMVVGETTHDILLLGYFPQITAEMRVVDDVDEVFGVVKVDVDDQKTLTRLQVRQVSPASVEGL